jgi:hypothetical protein
MRDTYKLTLLHSIKNKLGVDSLIDAGFTYLQISEFITDLTNNGLIDKELNLTDEGNEALKVLNKKFNNGFIAQWLQPQNEYRIDKIDLYDVYLPK